jgi:hypothetical protein
MNIFCFCVNGTGRIATHRRYPYEGPSATKWLGLFGSKVYVPTPEQDRNLVAGMGASSIYFEGQNHNIFSTARVTVRVTTTMAA